MKKALLSLVIIWVFTGAVKNNPSQYLPAPGYNVAVCGGVDYSLIQPGPNGKFISIMPGVGHHHYRIHTSSDSAQHYFDQGLSFYYGYHFSEALASFKEAARFDRNCAMAYWGQALALGPFYNNYNYQMSKEVPGVLLALQKANTGTDARENDLFNAMQQRYSSDFTNADRKELDLRYADAMRKLSSKYPTDPDIKALYIDAGMLCHKWDFWHTDGSPQPWTPELVANAEALLKTDPKNPAAIHYYIHLTEASRTPERSLAYADRLKDLMPGVAHMVHMATHAYQRGGLFAKGVTVNEEAYRVFRSEDSITLLHLSKSIPIHFFAVQSYCAMNAGMYAKGMPLYLRARDSIVAMKPIFAKEPYAQFVYMTPVMAWVRLGKWEEILQAPKPDLSWKYALIIDDFAKGMAQVRQHNITAAREFLTDLKTQLTDSLLAVRRPPYNQPKQSGQVAAAILTGEIFYAEGKTEAAINALKEAVSEEDRLIYREPQEWLIPARQYLGYYLLKLNKVAEAEKVYQADLVANPGNGWSLIGLYQTAKAQRLSSAAARYRSRYRQAFATADKLPVASVF